MSFKSFIVRSNVLVSANLIYPDIEIPSAAYSIKESVFSNNKVLTSVTIPSSVKSIGYRSFYNCPNLKVVTLNEGLKEIHEEAFMNCPKLETIIIPASVDKIGDRAFCNCKNLKNIIVNSNIVIELDNSDIFEGCPSFHQTYLPDREYSLETNRFQDLHSSSFEYSPINPYSA